MSLSFLEDEKFHDALMMELIFISMKHHRIFIDEVTNELSRWFDEDIKIVAKRLVSAAYCEKDIVIPGVVQETYQNDPSRTTKSTTEAYSRPHISSQRSGWC